MHKEAGGPEQSLPIRSWLLYCDTQVAIGRARGTCSVRGRRLGAVVAYTVVAVVLRHTGSHRTGRRHMQVQRPAALEQSSPTVVAAVLRHTGSHRTGRRHMQVQRPAALEQSSPIRSWLL